ncbi:MAG: hypothetical protein LN413_00140 [Candidatus Thermoplasmatota archaeon]|nr:hypothetical protein [Candidatus Thermoplasmatota archaeon]
MVNQHLVDTLTGIQRILIAVHMASSSVSSASRGRERETFVHEFLSKVLPTPYRFGTGDAMDLAGYRTGQLDVVVEHPNGPSLPLSATGTTRLYMAESVAAVLEVKSDVSAQSDEAIAKAEDVAKLSRGFSGMATMGSPNSQKILEGQIPFFVVGYTGWKGLEKVAEHVDSQPNIDGILVVDAGLFASSQRFGGVKAQGSISLWALIHCLHQATVSVLWTYSEPADYVRP